MKILIAIGCSVDCCRGQGRPETFSKFLLNGILLEESWKKERWRLFSFTINPTTIMQNRACDLSGCPRDTQNYTGPFYFPHDKSKVRFIVVTEQYPPGKRWDENGIMKTLQDIENELAEQCKNRDQKSVVPKYILDIFGVKSLDIRNGTVYWTHMFKCFSNIGSDNLGTLNKKEKDHPENIQNIRQSSSYCSQRLQNEICGFENLEYIIPFGQNAMNSVCEALARCNCVLSFHSPQVLKKPFYQIITEASGEGYTVATRAGRTIHILPFYHPSRRNIFEDRKRVVLRYTNVYINDISTGSFVKGLRDSFQ